MSRRTVLSGGRGHDQHLSINETHKATEVQEEI